MYMYACTELISIEIAKKTDQVDRLEIYDQFHPFQINNHEE